MNLKKFLYYVPFYVPFFMLHHITAKLDDIHRIETLMESSISTLLGELLNKQQLEAAKESMGLDTQLILDKTYFLVKKDEVLVGSGGYSYRKTLFGGNHTPNRSDDLLVPGKDAAKVRAMYTDPSWIRQGVGTYILNLAESSIEQLGFNKAELMATVSGIFLYEKRGYTVIEEIEYESKQGNKVPMYKMEKILNG